MHINCFSQQAVHSLVPAVTIISPKVALWYKTRLKSIFRASFKVLMRKKCSKVVLHRLARCPCALAWGHCGQIFRRKVHRVHSPCRAHRMFTASSQFGKGLSCTLWTARSENDKYVAKSFSTWLPSYPACLAYLLHNKESCYIFCLATTSLIDIEIAWPMHYEQLD